jgi:hypothetical protein
MEGKKYSYSEVEKIQTASKAFTLGTKVKNHLNFSFYIKYKKDKCLFSNVRD